MKSTNAYFESFLKSGDTVRVISPDGTVFRSQKRGISPLLSYIEQGPLRYEVVVLDKVAGNAAALLMKKVLCREVFSSLGSKLAAETLEIFGITRHFTKTFPILSIARETACAPLKKCPWENPRMNSTTL